MNPAAVTRIRLRAFAARPLGCSTWTSKRDSLNVAEPTADPGPSPASVRVVSFAVTPMSPAQSLSLSHSSGSGVSTLPPIAPAASATVS